MSEIRFNTQFYPAKIVKKAVEDYREAAEIEIKEEGDNLLVSITPKEEINNIEAFWENKNNRWW